MQYRADIDGLRTIAVLSVVLYHAFPNVFPGGFIGVDVFFVISGYLISTIIINEINDDKFSIKSFYCRRIKRIFPALILVLVTTLAFGWFVLLATEYQQVGLHVLSSVFFVVNFVLEHESGYFDNAAETKQLLHIWSLSVEEQFYLIWPIVLLFFWKRLDFILLLLILSFLYGLYLVSNDVEKAFYWPLSRFWELIFGCVLSIVINSNAFNSKLNLPAHNNFVNHLLQLFKGIVTNSYLLNLISFFILVAYICFVLFLEHNENFPGYVALMPVFFASFFIYASNRVFANNYIFSSSIFVKIGLISFPLYLWHWPIISFQSVIYGNNNDWLFRLTAIAFSFILAWLTYKFLELPIRKNNSESSVVKYLLIMMLVLSSIGFTINEMEGIPSRDGIAHYQNNFDELKRTEKKEKDCLSFLNIVKAEFDYCRVTDIKSNQTIAIIGDSHAHVAYPGIAQGLTKNNLNTLLLANSSCPPFLHAPWGRTLKQRERCELKINQIVNLIYQRDDIVAIIMFTRGPVYWTGAEPSSDLVKVPSLDFDSFFSGMQNTLYFLSSKNIDVYYVTENPELLFHPRDCLPRPLNIERKYNCNIDYDAVMSRQATYLNKLQSIKHVKIINGLNMFCTVGKQCSAFNEENELLYADDDHLSITGSKEFYKHVLEPILRVY